jgi:hypothetical protein
MKALMTLCFVVLVAPSLRAQKSPSNSVNLPTEREAHEAIQAVNSVRQYCTAVERSSDSLRPRLFAASSRGADGASGWIEFSNKAEWERAGGPQPVAVAWYKDGNVVRAMVSFKNAGNAGYSHADYCYQADGKLAMVSTPLQSDCDDAYFRCEFNLGPDWIYPPNGKVIRILHPDQRLLKSEKTSYLFQTNPPQYVTIWDLPFNGSTYIHTR